MVTYKYVTEVVRNRCVIAISVEALIVWIIYQINTNIANQTNKLNK